ncbi:DUF2752 domain-containing protein [Maribacter algarum]|uniref:DUF2752 domain-containing protein n=1 Tax=Maribacter algarum (ex Zhang et al. 2020) TaxID=2578118 RepID=A0A5S3PI40_9FLAO|nr:DUF2752 domain-containing protein [Maribacter algarum]TMM53929.1 DUF2752 domain-containing protein [Maribacter algarum]
MFLLLQLEDYMLPCFTKKIIGIDCPGCGLQRSVAFLFQGDFLAAWEMYPAIFAILPLFVVLALDRFFQIKYANKITIFLVIATVGLILTNYILKFI